MKIRAATLDDWPVIEDYIGLSNREQAELYGAPDYTDVHRMTLRLVLENGSGGVFIAHTDEGDPIGFTGMVHFDVMPSEVVDGVGSYTVPEWRRSRVGYELWRACEAFHAALGRKEIRGSVLIKNGPSVARCLEQGAEIVGFLLRYPIGGT